MEEIKSCYINKASVSVTPGSENNSMFISSTLLRSLNIKCRYRYLWNYYIHLLYILSFLQLLERERNKKKKVHCSSIMKLLAFLLFALHLTGWSLAQYPCYHQYGILWTPMNLIVCTKQRKEKKAEKWIKEEKRNNNKKEKKLTLFPSWMGDIQSRPAESPRWRLVLV